VEATETGSGTQLRDAITQGEDLVGAFTLNDGDGAPTLHAWSNLIQDDTGRPAFRLVALASLKPAGATDDLQNQLREKDTLLRELQHRVKNNLQMITALIRLEARNLADEASGPAFERLAGRVNALALLYQSLSAEGTFGDSIDLGLYLSEIATAVMKAHAVEGIRLDLKVDAWPVSINVAMPTGLVVNELLTNALKYAFVGRDGGTIRLRSIVDEAGCRVSIADDGVGMAEGAQWPRPGRLGALIVQSLRENAGAKVKVATAPGQGVEVTIFFALDDGKAENRPRS
jgi:two-component sensor histidine kinase